MALPAIAAAGIGVLGSVVGNVLNTRSTKKTNERSERFSREMYERQRADALSDWHMQNSYNDPSAVMQRLQNAGLNPALAYGNGAQAQATSAPRGSTAQNPNFKPPQVQTDAGSIALMALQAKQLQSNIARTDAETAAILARTTEQNYRNMAFTPELFTKELEAKINAANSGAFASQMSGDLSNQRANIADLERENLALISGHGKDHNRFTTHDNATGINQVQRKFEAEIQNVIQRTQNLQTADAGLNMDNILKKYEVDIMQTLGVDKGVAMNVLQNLMKIFLMTYQNRK